MALGHGKGQSKDAPVIYLAALGKHPGWDDHIEDIGIETDLLAQVRRWLYIDGISGNIESGAWEKLAEDQRLPGFAHDFVWWFGPVGKEPARTVVGRMWSSRDGKGRSKYPMAVYAEGVGIPLAAMVREVMPALVSLERKCVEASSASAVRMVIDQTRSDLRSALGRLAPEGREPESSPAAVLSPQQVAQVLDHEAMGPVVGPLREGLARTLYAVERELGAFLAVGGDSRKSKSISVKVSDVKAGHLRLPALDPAGPEAAIRWISLLSRRLAEGVAIMAIAPRGESFVDVIVGEPGAAQFYCVRATAKGFPLTTEVPYVIDDAFRARAAELIARWSGKTPEPSTTPSVAAPTPTLAAKSPSHPHPPSVPAPSGPERDGSGKRGVKKWLFGGAAGIVVVGAAVAVMMSRGDDTNKAGKGNTGADVAVNTPSTQDRTAPPVRPTPPDADSAASDAAVKAAQAQKDLEARLATERAAKEAADKVLAEKQAADKAAKEEADRQAKDLAARQAKQESDRLAQEAADRDTKELAIRQEADRQAKEAADKEAKDRAAREAKDKADREARDNAQTQRAVAEKALAQLSQLIADGAALDDPAVEGKNLSQMYDGVRASTEFGSLASTDTGRSVTDRMTLLAQVGQSDDPEFLASRAEDVADGKFAVALAAADRLSRLPGRPWPKDAAEAGKAAGIAKVITSGAAGVKDKGRAVAAASRAAAVCQRLWLNRWDSIPDGDAAEQSAAINALPEFAIDPESLPAINRYNVLLVPFRLAAASADDNARRELAMEFIADAGRISDLPQAAAKQVADLSAAIAQDDAQAQAAAKAGPALDQAGPGSLPGSRRWRLISSDAASVVFTPPEGSKISAPIGFARVQTSDGPAYVQVQEMSVGLFAALVGESGDWAEFAKTGTFQAKLNRTGPTVWECKVSGNQAVGIIPSTAASGDTGRGWFDLQTSMDGVPYFEPGKEPKAPSARDPIQYISPAAAVYVARLAGCRLPTVGEARMLIEQNRDSSPNRRDASWMAATEYLARTAGSKTPRWLDGGVFLPAEASELRDQKGKAVPAIENDDGSVLFREVDAGEATGVRDIVGNVAEMVFIDSASASALPSDSGSLLAAVRKNPAIRIIGASALSPKEIDPAQPYQIPNEFPRAGFSDVGFRLAFSASGGAPQGDPGAKLRELIGRLAVIED